ncbi:hypothetical protein HUA74_06680 [Myxococcus sp. CA051A]|uniref:hypothetical protein n=1 Tax=Myxococcus sp. CA051A TaxID=2741739 RepID=UPI00157B5158|nr:hypothetical protein [Myxococcus sp. CA051A]NTX60340.1 hypothetical protein [Myxococcus sp. CA051A]
MIRLSARQKVRRLLRIFERGGGPGARTRPFEDFPPEVQGPLLEQARLREGELPVLACVLTEAQWVLLTTSRVVIRRPEGVQEVDWGELKDATTEGLHVDSVLASGARGKLALSRLMLVRHEGEAIELELEAGPPFFGLWNALKSVASRNQPN